VHMTATPCCPPSPSPSSARPTHIALAESGVSAALCQLRTPSPPPPPPAASLSTTHHCPSCGAAAAVAISTPASAHLLLALGHADVHAVPGQDVHQVRVIGQHHGGAAAVNGSQL
jgi:hypothetical protein